MNGPLLTVTIFLPLIGVVAIGVAGRRVPDDAVRWIALLTNQLNIREVQAFPKTGSGSDLMLGAPSPVEAPQLAELGLQLRR